MPESGNNSMPALQAILLATSESDAFGTIVEHTPVELMPLANVPFIGRIAGWLVGLGVKEIAVLVSHRVDLFSDFLGDGSRWGAKIRVVAVASEAQSFGRLPELISAEFALIGRASALPEIDAEALKKCAASGGGRFVLADGSAPGWSLVPRTRMSESVRECKRMDEFEQCMAAGGAADFKLEGTLLRAESPAELLRSSRAMLDGLRPDQLIPGASAEKGVYISRNVVMHPTVRVTPPVVIGADCNIDRGGQIGPYAVIGDHTILGEHTTLDHAIVFPGTYIGPHLELSWVVVDHTSLAYGDAKGAVPVPDPFLLSASRGQGLGRTLQNLFRRVAACVLMLPIAPALLLLYVFAKVFCVKNPMRRIEAVSLPAVAAPELWRTFHYIEFDTREKGFWQSVIRCLRLTRLPTVWNVAHGDAAWVGLRPLTPDEMSALPTDWRHLYAAGKVGLVRLAELDQLHAGKPSDDQIYSSEAYYVATHNFKTDLVILWRAIWSGSGG